MNCVDKGDNQCHICVAPHREGLRVSSWGIFGELMSLLWHKSCLHGALCLRFLRYCWREDLMRLCGCYLFLCWFVNKKIQGLNNVTCHNQTCNNWYRTVPFPKLSCFNKGRNVKVLSFLQLTLFKVFPK